MVGGWKATGHENMPSRKQPHPILEKQELKISKREVNAQGGTL